MLDAPCAGEVMVSAHPSVHGSYLWPLTPSTGLVSLARWYPASGPNRSTTVPIEVDEVEVNEVEVDEVKVDEVKVDEVKKVKKVKKVKTW